MINTKDAHFLAKNPKIIVMFLSLMALAFTSTVDVFFSKVFLNPTDAGIYAQLSITAKIIYFGMTPIAIILFERFITSSINSARFVVGFSGLVVLGSTMLVALQTYLISIFFKLSTYNHTTFTYLCVAFALYTITTLLVYRLIARKGVTSAAVVSIFTAFSALFLIGTNSDGEQSIASAFMLSQLFSLLIALLLQYTKKHGK